MSCLLKIDRKSDLVWELRSSFLNTSIYILILFLSPQMVELVPGSHVFLYPRHLEEAESKILIKSLTSKLIISCSLIMPRKKKTPGHRRYEVLSDAKLLA